LHLGFKLGRTGEQIGLAGYNTTDYIDSLTYGKQYSNSSLSRYPDGNNKWINAPSSPGNTNEPYDISGIYINEFMPDNEFTVADEHGEYDDWIEIYNSTNEPVDIGGLLITDDFEIPTMHRISTTCPDSTTIPANGYILLWADNQEEQGVLHLAFKLNSVNDEIGLAVYKPDHPVYIDSASYNFYITSSKSYAKKPDGTGEWTITDIPTPNESNIITTIDNNDLKQFKLYQNLPNPFYQETVIGYYMPEEEYVAIEIFSIAGEKVSTLFAGRQTEGNYTIRWNATNDYGKTVPAGIYICTMTTKTSRASKMIVYY